MIAVPSTPMTPCAMPIKSVGLEPSEAAIVSAAATGRSAKANVSTNTETAELNLDVLGAIVVVTSIGVGLFFEKSAQRACKCHSRSHAES